MSVGVFLAAAALAQAAEPAAAPAPAPQPAPAYGPPAPAPRKLASRGATHLKDCSPDAPDPESGAIVVCVERPNGYRIDPDVLAAKKMKRQADTGGPRPPERFPDTSCSVVGAMGCAFAPSINLLAAAATVAKIADRVSKGEEVGSVFRTEPQMSEYEYYKAARTERERKEKEAAVTAYAARIDAEASASGADRQPQAPPEKK